MNEELTVAAAAQLAGVSRQTIYTWMKKGLIKSYGMKHATRIDRESLDAYIRPAVTEPGETSSGDREGAAGL